MVKQTEAKVSHLPSWRPFEFTKAKRVMDGKKTKVFFGDRRFNAEVGDNLQTLLNDRKRKKAQRKSRNSKDRDRDLYLKKVWHPISKIT